MEGAKGEGEKLPLPSEDPQSEGRYQPQVGPQESQSGRGSQPCLQRVPSPWEPGGGFWGSFDGRVLFSG